MCPIAANNKKKKASKLSSELLSMLLWGVYDRYFLHVPNHLPEEDAIEYDLSKGQLSELISNDVWKYCVEKYSYRNEDNEHIPTEVIRLIRQNILYKQDEKFDINVKPIYPNENLLIKKEAYEKFKNIGASSFHSRLKNFKCEIGHHQLEALCLYAYDECFEKVNEMAKSHIFFSRNGHVTMVRTIFQSIFIPSLTHLLDSMQTVSKSCNSELLKKRTSKMFERETSRLFKAVSEGRYSVPNEDYFDELSILMEDAEIGFGVNIPKFNNNWKKKTGQGILQINKRQAEGTVKSKTIKTAFRYHRIFLLEGKENNPLIPTPEEHEMILDQINHNVKVYGIFKPAYENLSTEEVDALDFAVIRIDGAPTLMQTRFQGELAEGIFSIDTNVPANHFKNTLANILTVENAKYIFEGRESDLEGDIKWVGPLSKWDIQELNVVLKAIYS